MDMYQKRKMRAENKMNSEKEEKKNNAGFNWGNVIYENYLESLDISIVL